jgi:hypothetical protein
LFSRRVGARVLPSHSQTSSPKKGGGAPTGATVLGRISGCGSAPCANTARSPLGAPPRFPSQRERFDSAQAALHASERMRALPAPSFALKRGTSHTGHNAGGDDARTARERGYKPRPREPHSLHVQVCLENTPFDERDSLQCNLYSDDCQGIVSVMVTFHSGGYYPCFARALCRSSAANVTAHYSVLLAKSLVKYASNQRPACALQQDGGSGLFRGARCRRLNDCCRPNVCAGKICALPRRGRCRSAKRPTLMFINAPLAVTRCG